MAVMENIRIKYLKNGRWENILNMVIPIPKKVITVKTCSKADAFGRALL
jgi:hypothetical protein